MKKGTKKAKKAVNKSRNDWKRMKKSGKEQTNESKGKTEQTIWGVKEQTK